MLARRLAVCFAVLASFVAVMVLSAESRAGAKKPALKPQAPVSRPLLSVYVGNDPRDLAKFERWLGGRVDGFQIHTGVASWEDWEGSIPWQIQLWKGVDREIFWSIPLIPKGSTLEAAAKGEYDAHYERTARLLAEAYGSRARIFVRTGWEFNGDWMYWTAHGGKAPAFIAAFQHFVTTFRRVSDKFVFEWTPNIGEQGMNPEDAYPGDDYVDIIGLDFYYNKDYDPPDGAAAFTFMRKRKYGLEWFEGFAAKHNKPTAYAEWGVMSNDTVAYMRDALHWFEQHNVVYQSYWNSNQSFTGKLSDDQFPDSGKSYRKAFAKFARRAP